LNLIQKTAQSLTTPCIQGEKRSNHSLSAPKVSTGLSFCDFVSANTSCAFSPRSPCHPFPCIFMYIALCTRRESVGKHGVYVWVMVWRNGVGMGRPGRGGLDPIDHKPRPRHITRTPSPPLATYFCKSRARAGERARKKNRKNRKWEVREWESSIMRIVILFRCRYFRATSSSKAAQWNVSSRHVMS